MDCLLQDVPPTLPPIIDTQGVAVQIPTQSAVEVSFQFQSLKVFQVGIDIRKRFGHLLLKIA